MKLLNKKTINENNPYLNQKVFKTVKENMDFIKKSQGDSWDFVTKEITLKNDFQSLKIGLAYFAGLVDQPFLNKIVNDTISHNFHKAKNIIETGKSGAEYFKNYILTTITTDESENYGKVFNLISNGDMVIFIDGIETAIIIGARKYMERPVEKATAEVTVKGSHDAFNENLLTNISLIRRRIKNPNLRVKNYILGKESNTNVAIMYIKDLADETILQELDSKMKAIEAQSIIDSGNIEEFIKGKQFSLFPLVFDSERPATIAANIMEGRIAIAVDTSPFVLIVPTMFVQFFQSSEDYFTKGVFGTFFRLIRALAFIIALYLPALYISLLLHHSELLPVQLLYSVSGQRLIVPFPSYLELLLIMVVFDLLRESGVRMPSAIGASLSFVGAIIIGTASVEAGLISSIVVIIAAISGISAFIMPNYHLTISVTVIKYLVTLASVLLGFYGLSLAMVVIITHICSLRSFGVNYFSPFAPTNFSRLKDSIVRFSLKNLFNRPKNK